MPIEWDGPEASFLVARLEHEPSVGIAVAQAKTRLMTLAPILCVARRVPTLPQSPPVNGLGDDFPDLPRHAFAVRVFTMRHGRP